MPPVTPRATSIGSITRFLFLNLLHRVGDHFLLGHRRFLVIADGDARHRPGEQLAGAGARGDDELERVGQFASINHGNVLTMSVATPIMRLSRARSARTIPCNRST